MVQGENEAHWVGTGVPSFSIVTDNLLFYKANKWTLKKCGEKIPETEMVKSKRKKKTGRDTKRRKGDQVQQMWTQAEDKEFKKRKFDF